MKPFYKTTEFWITLLSVYFFPGVVIGYNLSRGLTKLGSRLYQGFQSSELYLSLVALGLIYYQHLSYLIGAGIVVSYCLSRGLTKLDSTKAHNVKISI